MIKVRIHAQSQLFYKLAVATIQIVSLVHPSGSSPSDVSTQVTIEKLAPNEVYLGPDPQNTNDICACNSVVYSLLSACAACQDRFFIE